MRQHGRDLAHGGQARAGVELLLLLARQFLGVLAVGNVEDRAHPAGVAALAVDQGRLEDQHRQALPVRAQEDGLELGRDVAGQHAGEALLVLGHRFGRPVGHRRRLAHQLLARQSDHLAEGRVDVGDAALQVARAQPGHERVLHRRAKRHLLAQGALGGQAARDVAPQGQQARQQAQRQRDDRAHQQIGQQPRRALDAVGVQGHVGAGQVERALVGVHAAPGAGGGALGQQMVVAVHQRDRVVLGEPPGHGLVEQALQAVDGHQVAAAAPVVVQRQVVLDHGVSPPRAVGLAVAPALGAARHVGGRACALGQRAQVAQVGAGGGDHAAVGVEPGQRRQLVGAAAQLVQARRHLGRVQPGRQVAAQGAQRVLVARHFKAHRLLHPQGVGDQLFLALVAFHLARLPRQPQQHGEEQQHQQQGQQPAPGAAKLDRTHVGDR